MNIDKTDPRTRDMKRQMAEWFAMNEYEYREDPETEAEVVCEDEDVVIVADHSGHELNEWARDLGVDRSDLSETMHKLARQKCDYSWSVSDPVVFEKLSED